MSAEDRTRHSGVPRPVTVLLVEDNPGDVRLAREAFGDLERSVELTHVASGTEALDTLRTSPNPPTLVLLDLDLPGDDGHTVLEAVKSEPELRRIPIVVFTTSDDPRDVARTYDRHANAYVTKPQNIDQFFDVVHGLESFWFDVATLPEDVHAG